MSLTGKPFMPFRHTSIRQRIAANANPTGRFAAPKGSLDDDITSVLYYTHGMGG